MYRQIISYLFVLLIGTGIYSCGKGGGGGSTPTPTEENLVIGVDPDPGTTPAAALGSTYDFKVLIKSKMPSGGVKLDIVCTKDADNSTVSSQSLTGSAAQINANITSLQPGILYTVKVTATSASKPSNTTNTTFKLARK